MSRTPDEIAERIAEDFMSRVRHAAGAASRTSAVPCCLCGGSVVEFTIENADWNVIVRPDGREHDKEYLCVRCFGFIAAERLRAASRVTIDDCPNLQAFMEEDRDGRFGPEPELYVALRRELRKILGVK